MSNSGEDRLSTPTDECVEVRGPGIPSKEESKENVPHPPSKTSLRSSKRNSNTIMTHSTSPDHEIAPDDSKIPRRVAQISEENLVLKRQLKKQEERTKILATKLIRVISERSNKTKREEILLEEQKSRIGDLQHEVSNLRDKLHVTKEQLSSYTRLIPHPPSRQASMLSSSTATSHSKLKKPRSARSSGSQPPRPSTASSSRGNLIDKTFADRVEQLLLEAKAENQALEDQLKHCRKRLADTEEELERSKADFKSKEVEHQEQMLSIKSQLDTEQDIVTKKKQLSDNIQLIRLQRESRRTASWLSTLEAQCRSHESNLASATEAVQQLEAQLGETQEELGQELQKNITLQKQMEDATSSFSHLKELEAQITALQEENKIMKETNESLLNKAFAVTEKAEKAESVEMSLRVQMTHLETVLKSEIRSRNDLQESLRQEKEKCTRLELTNDKLQETLDQLGDEMKNLKLAPSCQNVEPYQIPSNDTVASTESGCTNETCPHSSKVAELETALNQLRHQLITVQDEQSETKVLLRTQVAANKEYQREVENLTTQLENADKFYHKKLQDFVKILEERTKQIAFFEKCINEWKSKQTSNSDENLCKNCRAAVNVETEKVQEPEDNYQDLMTENVQPVDFKLVNTNEDVNTRDSE